LYQFQQTYHGIATIHRQPIIMHNISVSQNFLSRPTHHINSISEGENKTETPMIDWMSLKEAL